MSVLAQVVLSIAIAAIIIIAASTGFWHDYWSPVRAAERAQQKKVDARVVYFMTMGFGRREAERMEAAERYEQAKKAHETGGNP